MTADSDSSGILIDMDISCGRASSSNSKSSVRSDNNENNNISDIRDSGDTDY